MAAPVALALRSLGFVPLVDFEVTQDGGVTRIMWLSAQPQPEQATLDAITEEQAAGALATRTAQAAKAAANASIDRGGTSAADVQERKIRCVVDICRAEFNRHTDVEVGFAQAVANATGGPPTAVWNDFKARVAAITPVPQRSIADLEAAIKTALAATAE